MVYVHKTHILEDIVKKSLSVGYKDVAYMNNKILSLLFYLFWNQHQKEKSTSILTLYSL